MIFKRSFLMRILFLVLSTLVLFTGMQAHAQSESIAAVVNQDAISQTDVNDRMKLIIASSGLGDTPDTREKLRPQILNSLVEEQLKIQEAKRLEITVTPEEVEEGFASIAAQN